MSTRMVNIPRDVIDDYYRYKMPVLKAKVEGKGNGIKTVVENMEDIARALNRPATYTTKYFGFELGALTKIDTVNHKCIVNGKRDAEDLAVVLDSFIQRYVLCQKCRNPETILTVKGETISSKCKACGQTFAIDMTHKLSTYILRNPPEKTDGPVEYVSKQIKANSNFSKREEKTSAKARQAHKKEEVDGDAEKWSVDTSAAAVEARRRELLGTRDRLTQKEGEEEEAGEAASGTVRLSGTVNVFLGSPAALVFEPGKNPIPALQQYFGSNPDPKVCVQDVQNAAAKVRWSDTQTMKAIIASLFPDAASIRSGFYKKCDTLALFVQGSKHEKIVLYCLEKMIEKDAGLLKELTHVLNGFYYEGILNEETLIKWFDHVAKTADGKGTDPKEKKFAASVKEASAPFIEWLKTADSEDSEDYF